ncbi:MAG: hypothetical protein KatS3mg022_0748 [Armatimonadota bacterium]|nr:MAG: hypothetical protein KatS3mg022_0748 [Armatimonadota bacterium]
MGRAHTCLPWEETRRAMQLAEKVKHFVLQELRQQGFEP